MELTKYSDIIEKQEDKFDVEKEEALRLITDPNVVVLDVRTPEEIAEVPSLVEDPLNINYYDEDFESKIEELNREGEYLVVCRSGNRSMRTCFMMEAKGFKKLYNLKDGMDGCNA
ncbi:hypothetical protein PM10SUCC1_29030 [Propionigenium maris DSM 9537]|uniref:Rhodanese domain-containing protein n=1 Tax=Propionigenium maris DSM 9537 TaxID=1123000 RepID=A0A9W6GP18_9FUSO|nr:rhodanese-like domain-containing protein [Propionigenium maris]GLI57389.1 hypothetical protein PM10SUCC1_29030 [Propionigenium maris DSM 9537]